MHNYKPTILVTGSNGQLGKELRLLSTSFTEFDFLFTGRHELPVDNFNAVRNYFAQETIHYCINCAAYTTVDKAESAKDQAYCINADGAGNLALICKENSTRFIHLSTDFVFGGNTAIPYKEGDQTNPLNVYGMSKLRGEELVSKNNPGTIIIRTSWLYSSFGNNFVKTMLRLMREKESINVVEDQHGCPTYAADLAKAILQIISNLPLKEHEKSGIYHYANTGIMSWFEFAKEIKELTGSKCIVNAIAASQYPAEAKRPFFSALDTNKIQKEFGIIIPGWKSSLLRCLQTLTAI